MNENGVNGAKWPEDVRQKVEAVYEPVVRWISEQLEIDTGDAREAVHEVLRRLHNGQASRVRQWDRYLTRAAVREYKRSRTTPKTPPFSKLSQEDKERLYEFPAPGPSPVDQAAKREISAILRREIEKLPRRQRQVMTLDLEKQTDEEIRATLGLKSVATVRSHRRKAFARLRMKLPKTLLDE